MIEDISLKNDDRKNRSRRAGKPRLYLNIKDLVGDRDYKGPFYFCQGRGEVPSPVLPFKESTMGQYNPNPGINPELKKQTTIFLDLNPGEKLFISKLINSEYYFIQDVFIPKIKDNGG